MKAAVIHRYGDADVLEIEERPLPTPTGRELLVRVRFAGVNPVDWKMREGRNRLVLGPGWPKVLGHDLAGEVLAVGPKVSRFSVGDAVYAMNGLGMGAYATHAVISEKVAAAVPEGLGLAEAAALPMTSLTSLQVLRDIVRLAPGQRLLVNGASGGVGIAAIQLGKIFGAEVTGVCSARNVELVRGLGADHVIDYTAEEFTAGDARYDVVYDCVGNHSLASCRGVITPKGAFVSVKTDPLKLVGSRIANLFRGQRDTQILVAMPSGDDLAWIGREVTEGRYRPVIDRRFPLEAIREAHRYSETGRARGKLLIEMPGVP